MSISLEEYTPPLFLKSEALTTSPGMQNGTSAVLTGSGLFPRPCPFFVKVSMWTFVTISLFLDIIEVY